VGSPQECFFTESAHARAEGDIQATWGREHPVLLTPGAYWKPGRTYEVGLAVPVGVSEAPRLGVIVKITAEF